jgi:hypothetical protein
VVLYRNGFSNAGPTESTNYAAVNHGHLQATQETVAPHAQPSPRQSNSQVTQEIPSQTNGSNIPTQQQQIKQTGTTQQQSTTESQRPEGSQ